MRILLLGAILVLFLVYINAQEAAEAGAEYDDAALGEEPLDVVEEPTTTAKPRRSRLPATRTRSRTNSAAATSAPEAAASSNGNGHHQNAGAEEAEAPVGPPSKAPAKRVRTTTAPTTTTAPSEPAATKKSRATTAPTTKSPTATEVVSTYKRPKFPPRRLPIPPLKTTTGAPVDEFVDAEVGDAGAEAPLDPLPAEAPVEEEIGAEEAI